MKLDIDPLPISIVLPLLSWCYENNIDRPGVASMLENWNKVLTIDDEYDIWQLEVTEAQFTLIILKWL